MRNKVKLLNGNKISTSQSLHLERLGEGFLLLAILATMVGCDLSKLTKTPTPQKITEKSTSLETKLNQTQRAPAQFVDSTQKEKPIKNKRWDMRDYDAYATKLREEAKAITSDKTNKCDPQRIRELVKTLSEVGTKQKHLFANEEYLYSILFESLVPLYGTCQEALRSHVDKLPLNAENAFKGELCAVLREEAEGQDPPPGESRFKDSWCNMFEE